MPGHATCDDRSNLGPRLLMMVLHKYLILLAAWTGTCCQDKRGTIICIVLNLYNSIKHMHCAYLHNLCIILNVQYRWRFIKGTIHGCLMLTASWFTDHWQTRGVMWLEEGECMVGWYVKGWNFWIAFPREKAYIEQDTQYTCAVFYGLAVEIFKLASLRL